MKSKIISLLGLARSAGKTATGSTMLKQMSSVRFVFIASDASEHTQQRLENKCYYYKLKFDKSLNSNELSAAIGQKNRMAIGITDSGFAKKFIELIEGGQQWQK